MKIISLAVAAALLATSGAAAAQSANDARCILLASAFAKQDKDQNAQKLAEATFYFYLGRIASQETGTQLKTLFAAQAKTLTDANSGEGMNNCVKDFQTKIQLINSLAGPEPAPAPAKK
jgi:hypothetical protein